MNSLRSNIYVGFGVIISLLIAIALIGYSGARRLHESSTAMNRVSDVNAIVLQIDRDVQELQLRVGRYMATGHDALKHDCMRLNDRLVRQIHQQASSQLDPEMQDLFARMSEQLPEYRKHFDSVIEERGVRADLVQQQLPQQSAIVQGLLRQLNAAVRVDSQQADVRAAVLQCEGLFSQAEKLLLRYYIAADTGFFNQALDHLHQAVACVDQVTMSSETGVLRATLKQALQDYERIGIRAVQATRSYLFLVNVVMAGEASEVAYFSRRLRTLSDASRNDISAQMTTTVASVRRMTGLGIGMAVALGLLIAGRLGSSILRPVTALKETFRQLAAGTTVVAIPETHRNDEIGEMALAAEVFRQRNVEQQQLLITSESLTRELAAKAEELAATNADLDNFAYVASHDLKSPLRGIRQLASWIDEDAGHLLPEDSVKHFRAMQSRVRRMELLLDDLLNFSRIGRMEAEPEIVNVADVMEGIVDITDNPRNVVIHIPQPLPQLRTVRIPLEQVFLNLIGNAIKHNGRQEGGLVEVLWERQDQHYVFRIKDNGPGIEPQHHERVFQMYQRVGDPEVEGSGMGLAIVRKQIERLGGTIRLDSNPDSGVTFRVTWPATSA